MKLLWTYLTKYKRLLFGALLLAAINQGFSLLDPQIMRILVDRYASRVTELSQSQFIQGVIILVLLSMGTALVSRIAKNFQDYFVNVMVQRIGARLYAHSVQHSFSLPYQAFEDQRSGELLQKLQKARTDVQALIVSAIGILFFSLIGILFVLSYAFTVHWSIGLVYTLMIPALGTATFLISQKIKAAQKVIVAETASLSGSTTETLRNVELVKSLGLEQQEIDRLNTTNDTILQLELKKIVIIRKFSFIQGTLINTLRSILLVLMFWLIFQQHITMGEYFSLLIYSFFIFSPLAELGTVARQYQEARASMDQLEVILKKPADEQPSRPVQVGKLTAIQFQDVGFRYATASRPALEQIQVSIQSGQTIAFVGPSGSGKTTLVKLLAGLYKPTHGKLLFNDVDSQAMDYRQFRQRIGLVAQETQLFAGTIRENLQFVRPQATDAECLTSLHAAAADTILSRSAQGLDTRIGEGGLKLSGGERQRLAIARALLREPDLIIFDEATSSLDSITEQAITETIKDITAKKPQLMTVLIAHRLSTIAHADVIYVLERGKVVEHGSHAELLKQSGLYAALWRQQLAQHPSLNTQ
ncbi:MAG: ABC transporter ATP-binding protein [Patescibacteria group bacterium]